MERQLTNKLVKVNNYSWILEAKVIWSNSSPRCIWKVLTYVKILHLTSKIIPGTYNWGCVPKVLWLTRSFDQFSLGFPSLLYITIFSPVHYVSFCALPCFHLWMAMFPLCIAMFPLCIAMSPSVHRHVPFCALLCFLLCIVMFPYILSWQHKRRHGMEDSGQVRADQQFRLYTFCIPWDATHLPVPMGTAEESPMIGLRHSSPHTGFDLKASTFLRSCCFKGKWDAHSWTFPQARFHESKVLSFKFSSNRMELVVTSWHICGVRWIMCYDIVITWMTSLIQCHGS